jgi:hypothetical protein
MLLDWEEYSHLFALFPYAHRERGGINLKKEKIDAF